MKVGIDVLEIERFIEIEKDETKLKKMFTKNELDYFDKYQHKTCHIAGTFCAKEAFVKAIKTGFSKDVSILDVEVLHHESEDTKIDLSISHSNTISTAICIISD